MTGLQILPDAAAAARWLGRHVGGSLSADSRRLQPGDGFIAWPGYAHDARRFVGQALAAGAAACLVDAERIGAFGFDDRRIAAVPHLKRIAGAVASDYFGRPSERLAMVATTGTNGKTSTAWWTAQGLAATGRRCAMLGTLGVGEPPAGEADDPAFEDTGLTTPDAVMLQRSLRELLDRGFAACAIEASSIGLAERRLDGTHVDVALFSNLTQDHLDYHGSMARYWAEKRRLFDWPGLKAAVVNVDDAHGAQLAGELRGRSIDLWTCSMRGAARLRGAALSVEADGLALTLHEGAAEARLRGRPVGEFNAANLLLVIGALRALGMPFAETPGVVSRLGPVPGRMQRVAPAVDGQPVVVVDYAHSPDALEQVLRALRPLARSRGGRLWCVFGCGGNRDAAKRPMMGAIAARHAEHVVLTSDNPRHEAADFILAQILAGIVGHDEVDVIEDRRAAIADAVRRAAPTDVVLVAGKGHEGYQEIAGVRRPFSDVHEARAALRERAGVGA